MKTNLIVPIKRRPSGFFALRLASLIAVVALVLSGAACQVSSRGDAYLPPPASSLVDLGWYAARQVAFADLWDAGMGAWKPGFDGYCNVNLDRRFRPSPGPISAVSQSRAVYMNVEAYRTSGDERFRQAAIAACDYLASSFKDAQYGGFYWLLDKRQRPADARKDAYGQVHPILALADVASIADNPKYRIAALAQYRLLKEKMVDPKYPGSYRPSRDRDFSALKKTYNNSDVFTHWFEALLHLWDVTSGADRSEVTASINLSGNFLVQHMMVVEPGHPDSAYVAYYYGEDWKPSRKPFSGDLWDGSGYASPGHGIELAFLLSWANERGLGDATWVAAGERLINFCLRHAFDRATGGMLYDVCAYSGAPLARSAEYVYWPQCEAARALLHYAVVRGKTEYLGQFKQVEKILMDDFTDKAYGGLYPNLDRRLKPRADYKGDMWKTNYHFSMYVSEVHRLAATYPESIKK